jgi:hypothetical protein
MAKSKTETDTPTLPEPTIWARAVLLGTAVLGVAMTDRTLNAKNVEIFGQKVREAVQPLGPVAWALLQALETRAKGVGANLECDRLRTARSANSLCETVAKASATAIVEHFAQARFDTSSSAVHANLAAASQSLVTLEDPNVVSTLRRLAQLERGDLSAAKYLREARAILQQDEMRRSLQVDLRMVMGAAEAYLSTGKHSMLGEGAFEEPQDLEFTAPIALGISPKVTTPIEIVIASKRSTTPPPPSQPRPTPKTEFVKKNSDTETLASEDMPVLTRVNVERKATGLDRATARALLDEAYKEAVDKIQSTNAPMLVSVVLTYDVMREA